MKKKRGKCSVPIHFQSSSKPSSTLTKYFCSFGKYMTEMFIKIKQKKNWNKRKKYGGFRIRITLEKREKSWRYRRRNKIKFDKQLIKRRANIMKLLFKRRATENSREDPLAMGCRRRNLIKF